MSRYVLAAILAFAVAMPVPGPVAGAAPAAGVAGVGPGRVGALIVRYRTGVHVAMGATAPGTTRAGIAIRAQRVLGGGFVRLALPTPVSTAEAEAIAARVAMDPSVLSAEPDGWMTATGGPVAPATVPAAPTDPLYANQFWNYDGPFGIGMLGAWELTQGSPGVTVAVVDTGITAHPDLATAILGTGADLVSDSTTANDGDGRDMDAADPGDWITSAESQSGYFAGCAVSDSSWHGTHVTGTIAAVAGNGIGGTGVAPGVRVLPVRALGKCGGYTSDVADGILWAAGVPVDGVTTNAHPAQVISLSLGGPGACEVFMQDAITRAIAAGSIVVVAAGNENIDASGSSPANCVGVITVAATGAAGTRASYSNFGSKVTLAAPGGDGADAIVSTINSGRTVPVAPDYAGYEGTSMATPHVSAVIALMASVRPGLTASEARSILQNTATPFPVSLELNSCSDGYCGAGIVNARAAVAAAAGAPAVDAITLTVGITTATYGHAPIPVTASAASGKLVQVKAGPSASCTYAAGLVTLVAAGACLVEATTTSDGTYAAASASASITVARAAQVLVPTFPVTMLAGAAVALTVAGARTAVTYASATPSTCSLAGRTVTARAPGTCTVKATAAADNRYLAASTIASIKVSLRAAVPPGVVTINAGSMGTRSASVLLSLAWPAWATSAQVSSSPTFTSATTISRRTSFRWTVPSGDGNKRVYVRYRAANYAPSTVSDTIVLDRVVPRVTSVSSRVIARQGRLRRLSVNPSASGTGSQVRAYQVTSRTSWTGAWRIWKQPFTLTTSAGVLYVRVRDAAGNVSAWRRFYPPR